MRGLLRVEDNLADELTNKPAEFICVGKPDDVFSSVDHLKARVWHHTPPLGAPNAVVGAAGFGSITSAGDPRVLQFGLKVNF